MRESLTRERICSFSILGRTGRAITKQRGTRGINRNEGEERGIKLHREKVSAGQKNEIEETPCGQANRKFTWMGFRRKCVSCCVRAIFLLRPLLSLFAHFRESCPSRFFQDKCRFYAFSRRPATILLSV